MIYEDAIIAREYALQIGTMATERLFGMARYQVDVEDADGEIYTAMTFEDAIQLIDDVNDLDSGDNSWAVIERIQAKTFFHDGIATPQTRLDAKIIRAIGI